MSMEIYCSIVKIIFKIFVYCDRFSILFQLLHSAKAHGIIKNQKALQHFYTKGYFYDLY